jgi:catechol 2,3-dioxygenase-like lactoylglutathione lyase family enzyme
MANTFDLDHVSLFVRDLDISARFYAEVLRLPEIEKKSTRANVRWFGLGAGRAIHLILGATDVPASRPRSTHFLRRRASTRPFANWQAVGSHFRIFRAHWDKFRSDLTVFGRCIFRTPMGTGLRSTTLLSNDGPLIAQRSRAHGPQDQTLRLTRSRPTIRPPREPEPLPSRSRGAAFD